MKRRLASWCLRNLTFSLSIIFLSPWALAALFVPAIWQIEIQKVAKESEQRGRDKQVIVTLSSSDKACLEWVERNGAWRCVAR